jgi:hypothetical protein
MKDSSETMPRIGFALHLTAPGTCARDTIVESGNAVGGVSTSGMMSHLTGETESPLLTTGRESGATGSKHTTNHRRWPCHREGGMPVSARKKIEKAADDA